MRGVPGHRRAISALFVWLLAVGAGCSDAPGGASTTTTGAVVTTAPTIPDPSTTTTAVEGTVADATTTTETTLLPTTTTTTRPPLVPPTYESIERYHWIRNWSSYTARGLIRWRQSVPEIQDITIPSTADGTDQPVLWLPPSGDGVKPLLVILHSWSSNYLQHAGIPYALWAQENGWAVIAPEFRGRNDDADAIGSELAVQDVVDAIDFATAQDGVDGTRVFAVGYSGGGMMSLLLAGRHPDKVTAVAAWGPVYDLVAFYQQSRTAGRHYYWEIATACGGDPRRDGFAAQEECLRRSPKTYLDAAREAGVPVYLGHGLWDSILSPRQSGEAFNQLADPEDRFTEDELALLSRWRVPTDIPEPLEAQSYFGPGDPEVFLSIRSASVQLVYFRSNHDMAYQATMRWFASDPH